MIPFRRTCRLSPAYSGDPKIVRQSKACSRRQSKAGNKGSVRKQRFRLGSVGSVFLLLSGLAAPLASEPAGPTGCGMACCADGGQCGCGSGPEALPRGDDVSRRVLELHVLPDPSNCPSGCISACAPPHPAGVPQPIPVWHVAPALPAPHSASPDPAPKLAVSYCPPPRAPPLSPRNDTTRC